MKKALLAFFLVLCLGVSALGAEEGAYIGALARATKTAEEESPYVVQCELGSIAADAVREAAQADIALVPTADLTGFLPQGLLSREDAVSVLTRDEPVVCVQLSGAEVYALLETAVSHLELDTVTEQIAEGSEVYDGFCQISGFSFTYDVSAPMGERICEVTLNDGETLTAETTLTVAATSSVLDGTQTGFTLSDAMVSWLAVNNRVPADSGDRIRVLGARDYASAGAFSPAVLIGGVVVLGLLLVFWRRRYANYKDEYGFTK